MPIHRWDGFTAAPIGCPGAVLTIGNFDGVHRGHARLVQETAALAQELGTQPVVLTFEPHPVTLLRPELHYHPLAVLAERCRLLEAAGAREVLVLSTTAALLNLEAEEFFRDVLCVRLGVRGLVEGQNFAFGKNRRGTTQRLESLCRMQKLPLRIIPPVLVGDEAVSSSRTRLALLDGNVTEVRLCLGRPYAMEGTVSVGAKRGRALGFPTANLGKITTLLPGEGVYAARAEAAGKMWPAAVNVGPNPTFGVIDRKVEVHLIGYEGDLYEQKLRVEMLERLRDTRAFASADELKLQLERDVSQAREIVMKEAAGG